VITVDFDRLGVRAGERVLDLGCGFGRHAYEAMRRGASVVACDLGLAELKEVLSVYAAMQQEGELPDAVACLAANGDGTRLPFADASFDRVMASEVLEHIPDDVAAFDELARVLRPGGVLAISTPSRFSPLNLAYGLKRRIRRYAFNEHLHEFTPTSFRRLLEKRFEVERLEFANYVLPYPADELYLRAGSPGLGLLRRLEETLARTPVVRQLGWTMVARARTPLR
jgi:SAM-dependent methyltransferase